MRRRVRRALVPAAPSSLFVLTFLSSQNQLILADAICLNGPMNLQALTASLAGGFLAESREGLLRASCRERDFSGLGRTIAGTA